MLQQLLRRLVFDVPLLSDYCKMPLRVGNNCFHFSRSLLIALPPGELPPSHSALGLLACLTYYANKQREFQNWHFPSELLRSSNTYLRVNTPSSLLCFCLSSEVRVSKFKKNSYGCFCFTQH